MVALYSSIIQKYDDFASVSGVDDSRRIRNEEALHRKAASGADEDEVTGGRQECQPRSHFSSKARRDDSRVRTANVADEARGEIIRRALIVCEERHLSFGMQLDVLEAKSPRRYPLLVEGHFRIRHVYPPFSCEVGSYLCREYSSSRKSPRRCRGTQAHMGYQVARSSDAPSFVFVPRWDVLEICSTPEGVF